MLLNPFLVILYLIEIVKYHDKKTFAMNLIKAGLYSSIIFSVFAVVGDVIFRDIIQAQFASFQIFGGVIFLIIGVQFVLKGTNAIEGLRGDMTDVATSIAMPILVGPSTISAAVLMGKKLNPGIAVAAIFGTVFLSVFVMILLKFIHDKIHTKHENLIQKYIEVSGRILALYIGTVSIDMIMRGVSSWFTP
jgi:small neutral amino acid transporter SnatA (MarC family)